MLVLWKLQKTFIQKTNSDKRIIRGNVPTVIFHLEGIWNACILPTALYVMVCACVCLCACMCARMWVNAYVLPCERVWLPVFLSVVPSFQPSVYLSVSQFVCLSVPFYLSGWYMSGWISDISFITTMGYIPYTDIRWAMFE